MTTAARNVTELETYTGQFVDYLNPDPATIKIEDIANGLANTCRFGGQVYRYYSVAEHAILVASMVPDHLKLAALHHDSHEAYTGDIPAPLKAVLQREAPGVIREIQTRLDIEIFYALGIPWTLEGHATIKAADDEAMYREASALKYSHGIGEHWCNDEYYTPLAGIGWSPARAEREFLAEHERLSNA